MSADRFRLAIATALATGATIGGIIGLMYHQKVWPWAAINFGIPLLISVLLTDGGDRK